MSPRISPFRVAIVGGTMAAVSIAQAIPAGASVEWPPSSGWTTNGSASVSGQTLTLTDNLGYEAGSAFMNTSIAGSCFTASFDSLISNGPSGADGTTFAIGNATTTPATTLGYRGGGLGFTSTTSALTDGVRDGIGVALDTYQNASDPSKNFVGLLAPSNGDTKNWLATNSSVPALYGTHHVVVTLAGGTILVTLDGNLVLSKAVTTAPQIRLGFTAGTGGQIGSHQIQNFALDTSCVALPSGGSAGSIVITAVAAVGLGVTTVVVWRRRNRVA